MKTDRPRQTKSCDEPRSGHGVRLAEAEPVGGEPGGVTRRSFVRALGIAVAAPMVLLPRRASASQGPARRLTFHHLHTNERLSLVYYANGFYIARAIAKMSWFLRDHRNGEARVIDPRLFDVLHRTASTVGSHGTYEVICGYRSPATNEMLRAHTSGVAKNSLHIVGRAIDVRLTDLDTCKLRDTAKDLRCGGVGYYEHSDFVHLDTGRVRFW